MHDLQGVAFLQKGAAVRVSGEDHAVQLYHDPAGTDPELLKQLGHVEPCFDVSSFAVNLNDHCTKKTVPNRTTLVKTGPENTVLSSLPPGIQDPGTKSFTLPYAGTTRIRFKGLPGHSRAGLSVRAERTPLASGEKLADPLGQVNVPRVPPAGHTILHAQTY